MSSPAPVPPPSAAARRAARFVWPAFPPGTRVLMLPEVVHHGLNSLAAQVRRAVQDLQTALPQGPAGVLDSQQDDETDLRGRLLALFSTEDRYAEMKALYPGAREYPLTSSDAHDALARCGVREDVQVPGTLAEMALPRALRALSTQAALAAYHTHLDFARLVQAAGFTDLDALTRWQARTDTLGAARLLRGELYLHPDAAQSLAATDHDTSPYQARGRFSDLGDGLTVHHLGQGHRLFEQRGTRVYWHDPSRWSARDWRRLVRPTEDEIAHAAPITSLSVTFTPQGDATLANMRLKVRGRGEILLHPGDLAFWPERGVLWTAVPRYQHLLLRVLPGDLRQTRRLIGHCADLLEDQARQP